MARRNLQNIEDDILDAVTHIGGTKGIPYVTGRSVALACDISHFTCFNRFKTTQNMLDAAAIRFERKYMKLSIDLFRQGYNWQTVWNTVLDFLIQDADGTFYYDRYRTAFGFFPTLENTRATEFLEFAKVAADVEGLTDEQYMLLGDYISALAFFYARRIISGQLPDTPAVREFICKTVAAWRQEFPTRGSRNEVLSSTKNSDTETV